MLESRRDFLRLAIAAPLAGTVETTAPAIAHPSRPAAKSPARTRAEDRAEWDSGKWDDFEYGQRERPLEEAQADRPDLDRPCDPKSQAEARAWWDSLDWDKPYFSKVPPLPREQVLAELEAMVWEGDSHE